MPRSSVVPKKSQPSRRETGLAELSKAKHAIAMQVGKVVIAG